MNTPNSKDDQCEQLHPPVVNQNPLDFGMIEQGRHATLQEIISNTDEERPLLWTATTDGTSWLTLGQSTGTIEPHERQAVSVTVDTTDLTIGDYTATLTFTSEGDDSSASTEVLVRLVIDSQSVFPRQSSLGVGVDFGTLPPESSRTLPLVISNSESHTVQWTLDTGGVNWLTSPQSAGTLQAGERQTVYVRATTGSLEEGLHSAFLTFTSQGSGTSVRVPVGLYISDRPFYDNGPKPPQEISLSRGQSNSTLLLTFVNPPENGQVRWTVDTGGVSWLIPPRSTGVVAAGQPQVVQIEISTSSRLISPPPRTDLSLSLAFDPPQSPDDHTTLVSPITFSL